MSAHSQTTLRAAGSGTATPTNTQTIVQTNAGPSIPIATLRLRAEPGEQRHIRWAEEVIDNEGMGKKSSKVCCIYHKPREPGESDSDSDDSSSSDSSDDDSDSHRDLSRAQKAGGGSRKDRGRRHEHHDCASGSAGKGKERKASPNAYERQPKQKSKKDG